ncbi:MAG: UDP-N-acetylmuramoyl-tripeptide--D-alanyl-D-alanine ligase [Candidatus Pacebacteria bacterium]|nr:UDP-N-acetylmuramoyl-tripeptide--D-alanyl-D-alanine ligase [Candidatus Paceibacterota bacterium]NUQ57403.1 UDP-N-acetylmuramoyl-tripeptide--D-alanyl-D-alanine ligase [Candidatus Paceibacter sp.]
MIKKILKKIITSILRKEAKAILKKFNPKIVAVTGTVGKTSTKEAVALALESSFNVGKSAKSYNSEIGLPLAIIGAKSGWNSLLSWIKVMAKGAGVILFARKYPEILALEMGVDRPKDMEHAVSWVRPDVAVVTAVGDAPVHVEYFQDAKELIKEKLKLALATKENGTVILNADDETLASFSGKMKNKTKTLTFGFSPEADIRASNYKMTFEGVTFKIESEGSIIPARLNGLFGQHNVYAALAAFAAAVSLGVNPVKAAEAVSKMKPVPGRLNLLEGINGSYIFDDTYNSSPLALAAALEVMSEIKAKRKIAVFGPMMELGQYSEEEHRKAGAYASKSGIDVIFIVGEKAKFIAEGALEKGFDAGKIFEFPDSAEAGEALKCILEKGDFVLVKGSQSARMEKTVEKIMANPELKEELLVRQEKEWQKR